MADNMSVKDRALVAPQTEACLSGLNKHGNLRIKTSFMLHCRLVIGSSFPSPVRVSGSNSDQPAIIRANIDPPWPQRPLYRLSVLHVSTKRGSSSRSPPDGILLSGFPWNLEDPWR